MANCATCSAELIGSAKFCAACGAPALRPPIVPGPSTISGGVAAPTSPSSSVNASAAERRGADPNAPVNPFAVTAAPSIPDPFATTASPDSITSARLQRLLPSPSSEAPTPAATSQVSPLAVSNALSQEGAFQQAIGGAIDKARSSVPPPEPHPRTKNPGTQLMPSAPGRLPTSSAPPPPPLPKRPLERTVAMDFGGKLPSPGAPLSTRPSAGTPPASPSVPPTARSTSHPPPPPLAPPLAPSRPPPPSGRHPAAAAIGQPPAPYGHPPPSAYTPRHGWDAPYGAPQPVAGSYAHSFGYAPGARVQVLWSNGQRYPATVSQVSGAQHLVVFPDGQQHWVEAQYLAPA